MKKIKLRNKLIIASFISIVILEIFIRQFIMLPSNQVFDEEIGFTYVPKSILFNGREGFAKNRVNSLGLNNDEIGDKVKPRMLVLGDSYTEARHVDRKNNFISILDQNSEHWQYINAGREGLHIASTNILANRLGQKLDIDAVLLVISNGDIIDDLNKSKFDFVDEGGVTKVRPHLSSQESLKKNIAFLFRQSALLAYAARQIKKILRNHQNVNTAKLTDSNAKNVFSKRKYVFLQIIKELQVNYDVYVVYIHQLEYLSAKKAKAAETPDITEKVLSQWCRENNIKYTNTLDNLLSAYHENGYPPFGFMNSLPGSGHLNESGHIAVAEAISKMTGERSK